MKVAKLNAEIRTLKEAKETGPFGSAFAAKPTAAGPPEMMGGPPPHPATPLGIQQEEPEDIYAGPPTTYS